MSQTTRWIDSPTNHPLLRRENRENFGDGYNYLNFASKHRWIEADDVIIKPPLFFKNHEFDAFY